MPVIISHIAASGIDTFEQQINDVDNKDKNAPKNHDRFTPWGINACNDEIRALIEIGGIIGISLDQRTLGGGNKTFCRHIKKTLRRAGLSRNVRFIHTCLWLENIFHIVKTAGSEDAWKMICLSSDNDGIIDPIDSCLTVNHLYRFESLVRHIAYYYYQASEYIGVIFVQD